MEITREGEAEETQTVLVGRLADQSSLSGVLNTLHDLNLPVLSAECLGNGEEEEGPEQSWASNDVEKAQERGVKK
jgi:hypothetical protein